MVIFHSFCMFTTGYPLLFALKIPIISAVPEDNPATYLNHPETSPRYVAVCADP
jgi:hypothetical protein